MKNNWFKITVRLAILLGISTFWAQNNSTAPNPKLQISKYDYHDAFASFFYTKDGTNTRSASGQPRVEYWQNRADYKLSVKLNEEKKKKGKLVPQIWTPLKYPFFLSYSLKKFPHTKILKKYHTKKNMFSSK